MSNEQKEIMSRYNPKVYDSIAGTLAGLGYTQMEMSKKMGICRHTFNKWRKENESFNLAITDGARDADEKVVNSLYKRATGYSCPDMHISTYLGEVTMTPYTKHYPPDPTSMIFWLKNRDRDNWREKQVIAHEIADADYIKDTPAEIAAKMDNKTAPNIAPIIEVKAEEDKDK